jgi:diguanylate cyclase (GGDEF)-like protein
MEITVHILGTASLPRHAVAITVINALGFSIAPIILYAILLFINDGLFRKRAVRLLTLLFEANIVLSFISIKTGWIFHVTNEGFYSRGPYQWIPICLCLYYYFLIGIVFLRHREERVQKDNRLLSAIYLLPLLAIAIQMGFPRILVIWGSSALALLLFYIFLLERQFSYDIQTGLGNRKAFEAYMQELSQTNKPVTIFVFDLNNLKMINDSCGHVTGDEKIRIAADCMKKIFSSIGQSYRIGGDEFCAICNSFDTVKAWKILRDFDACIDKINEGCSDEKISIAHGFAVRVADITPYKAFTLADNAMYYDKVQRKNNQDKAKY